MKNAHPKTAFILAAGFGTRLLPLSLVHPKPLMPLWGQPMLEHVIRMLCTWHVERIIINLHHETKQIRRALESLDLPNVQIYFSTEPTILGTGGALAHAQGLLDSNPFWLLNADVASSLNPAPFVNLFHRQQPLAALWLTDRAGPRTVEMQHQHIANFRSKRPGTSGTFTFCGLHLLSPEILNWIPRQGFSSIITAYEQALKKDRVIAGLNPSNIFWSDIGTPQQYLDAHLQTVRAHQLKLPGGELCNPDAVAPASFAASVEEASAIDLSARIASTASVTRSVLWENTRLGRGVKLDRCIVASGVTLLAPGEYRDALFTPGASTLTAPEKRAASKSLDGPITVETLPPRGSNRSFYRLSAQNKESVLLIRYDDATRPENMHYAGHTRWLEKKGLPVPRLLHQSRKHRFLIMEDGGREDLTNRMQKSSAAEARRLYRRVLDAVVLLHTTGTCALTRKPIPLEKPFDHALYSWEHALFFDEFLLPRKRLTDQQRKAVAKELQTIADLLCVQPQVLIHRDLQSSNILLKNRRLFLIDYQGMRLGAAAYDLASLLYDP
ncbi:MAG: phosphotransferase, partial [Kiritimatiellae bacterium]|nr:phosphotransferase [Kiritimatiellia bacterium]